MQISARADYAVRAMLVLAARAPEITKTEILAEQQGLPKRFLEAILSDLRRAHLVTSQRGGAGGYRLASDPARIAVGAVLRAVDGPLAGVRGARPEAATYEGEAKQLQTVWVAARASLRSVLDEVSLAQIVHGELPAHVRELATGADAWEPR